MHYPFFVPFSYDLVIMKILFLLFIALFFSQASMSNTNKALFLGNSYTYVNNLPQMVADMASSSGDSLVFDSNTPGGYTLEQHLADSNSVDKIKLGTWDFVILQDQSQLPSFQDYDGYGGYALNQLVNQFNPCAHTIFYMTWGRKNGDALNCPVWPPVCTYNGMDSLLQLNYMELGRSTHSQVSPVGRVWKYIRQNYPGIELYQPDESHPSVAGTYLAACCFYVSIFGKDPLLINFNSSVLSTDASIIRQAVKLVYYDHLIDYDFGEYYPIAQFNYRIGTGVNEVVFTNQSTTTDNYVWDFGDGNSSTTFSPTHSYSSNGTYIISLTALNCNLSTLNQSIFLDTISFCPHTPTIFPDSLILCPNTTDTIMTQLYDSYQWLDYAGNPLQNDTLNYLIVSTGNTFSIETTLNGCTELSQQVFIDGYFHNSIFIASGFGNFIGQDSLCDGDTLLLVISPNKPPFPEIDNDFQWYKDGIAIPFSQNDSIYVTATGVYGVEIQDPFCPNNFLYQNLNMPYTFTFCNPGIDENKYDNILHTFPNPSTGTFQLVSNTAFNNEPYCIFNLIGDLVSSGLLTGYNWLIDLNDLEKGIYFLRTSKNVSAIKIVVQ